MSKLLKGTDFRVYTEDENKNLIYIGNFAKLPSSEFKTEPWLCHRNYREFIISIKNPRLYKELNGLEIARLKALIKKYGSKGRVYYVKPVNSFEYVTYYQVDIKWVYPYRNHIKDNFQNATDNFDWKCFRAWKKQFNQEGKMILNKIHWDKHNKIFYPAWGVFDKDLHYYNLYDYI